jgi:hypothetical protein
VEVFHFVTQRAQRRHRDPQSCILIVIQNVYVYKQK